MKQEMTKNQHFVPQFYLKQFTDENGLLYCYIKSSRKQFSARTEDICFKKYYYEAIKDKTSKGKDKFLLPNSLENMLSELEGAFDSTVKRIITICQANCNGTALICSLEEKKILASMVANFIVRNPHSFNRLVDNNDTEEIIKTNKEVETIDQLLKVLKMGDVRSFVDLAKKKAVLDPNEEGATKAVVDLLNTMNVSFLVSKDLHFLTSDCPVGYNFKDDSISMVRMPLSRNTMVVFSTSDTVKPFRNRARLIENKYVEKLNDDYIKWSATDMMVADSQKQIETITSKL